MGFCPDACAMGGYWGMGIGALAWEGENGEREGGGGGEKKVHMYVRMWAYRRMYIYCYMCGAQEEEKCLAADAGRLTHGHNGTYCYSRAE